MRKIEILTTQNVVIQYDAADLKDRILAFIIDFMVHMLIIWVIAIIFVPLIFGSLLTTEASDTVYYVVITPLIMFYNLFQETVFKGLTVGKKAMGIRVVKLNGSAPGFLDYVTRWIFRIVEIYASFGAIAALLISSSDRSQRIGDMLANTTVIKTKGIKNITLKDIENLPSRESYPLKYPLVTRFSDEEMLTLKQLLERVKEYPNATNRQLLEETSAKIAAIIGLEHAPKDSRFFIQELLNDYIVSTR